MYYCYYNFSLMPKGRKKNKATSMKASLNTASPEAALPEAASPEAASPEAASPEAASPEAASPEAASPEAASPKAASPKAAPMKAASMKASSPKAASLEAASPDAASLEAASPDADAIKQTDDDNQALSKLLAIKIKEGFEKYSFSEFEYAIFLLQKKIQEKPDFKQKLDKEQLRMFTTVRKEKWKEEEEKKAKEQDTIDALDILFAHPSLDRVVVPSINRVVVPSLNRVAAISSERVVVPSLDSAVAPSLNRVAAPSLNRVAAISSERVPITVNWGSNGRAYINPDSESSFTPIQRKKHCVGINSDKMKKVRGQMLEKQIENLIKHNIHVSKYHQEIKADQQYKLASLIMNSVQSSQQEEITIVVTDDKEALYSLMWIIIQDYFKRDILSNYVKECMQGKNIDYSIVDDTRDDQVTIRINVTLL